MDHLNYCRQMRKQFSDALHTTALSGVERSDLHYLVGWCDSAKKFLLPPGGVLLFDPELRAINEAEQIHLPFDFIALEYSVPDVYPSKRVVFARDEGGFIFGDCMAWMDDRKSWSHTGYFSMPKTGYLDRTIRNLDGGPAVLMSSHQYDMKEFREREPLVLLHFLNALACSNVRIERSEPKNAGKKIKAALPFDTYHVLTIDVGRQQKSGGGTADGSNRHPREHLRRGHIRRLEDGRRIWVNATVVAAGRGVAKIEKDYMMKNSTMARPAMPQAQRCGAAA